MLYTAIQWMAVWFLGFSGFQSSGKTNKEEEDHQKAAGLTETSSGKKMAGFIVENNIVKRAFVKRAQKTHKPCEITLLLSES